MEDIILEAQKRQGTGSRRVNRLRKSAFIPAVVYGLGESSLSIQLVTRDFLKLIGLHRGESFVLKLRIKDDSQPEGSGLASNSQSHRQQDRSVLIKQIQYHPVKDEIIHVDFNEISLTKAIRIKVPLVASGEAIGVKRDAGVLDHILWELDVECLPTQIPKSIEVDVSNLKIGDSLHVKNLKPLEGVKVLNDPEATILAVVLPSKEEIAPAAEEALATEAKLEPEVIKEKKEKVEAAPEAAGSKKAQEEKK